ncbi:MAG: hypothetical protein ACJ77K_05220 [Bacteroidia bacterium]
MRYIFIFLLCFSLSSGSAQTSITSIKANGDNTEITVSSSKKFYVGGNTHVLHIGTREFSLNKQANKDGKGTIIFYIPTAEFDALPVGEDVYLTYGSKYRKGADPKDIEMMCKKNPNVCWYLGKFKKTL